MDLFVRLDLVPEDPYRRAGIVSRLPSLPRDAVEDLLLAGGVVDRAACPPLRGGDEVGRGEAPGREIGERMEPGVRAVAAQATGAAAAGTGRSDHRGEVGTVERLRRGGDQ